jgi:aldose 1-epimerase
MRSIGLWIPVLAVAVACGGDDGDGGDSPAGTPRGTSEEEMGGPPEVSSEPWGVTPEGDSITLFTLTSGSGLTVRVADWGGIVTQVLVPDRDGRLADVVLGHDSLAAYVAGTPYFGAIVGRYANRIAEGRFALDGRTYRLATNNGVNHLHGGIRGFDKRHWDALVVRSGPVPGGTLDVPGAGRASVVLSRTSEDGEEGYPGRLEAELAITLTSGDEVRFDYEATADAPTVVNLTHHGYWNLAGHDSGDILGHELDVRADRFTPVDAGLIPTGELRSVEGTPFDFRDPTPIGLRIGADDEQLRRGGGYDHNFVLDDWTGDRTLRLAARLRDPGSGRTMEVLTTEPGIQLYSGNFLDGSDVGKGGAVYGHRSGLCLETQHFPDSPNRSAFPSTVLRPGETYRSTTVYRFRTD